MLLRETRQVISTTMTANSAAVAASDDVISGKRAGRHGITITADGNGVYIGGSDVTSTNGTPIADKASVTIPVSTHDYNQIYFIGTIRLLEYF